MRKRVRNDECLLCYKSLIKGIDLYHLIVDDTICFKCRSKLERKLSISKFNGYRLISFYDYGEEISKLIIRYKDLFDIPLASVFLKEYMWLINTLFKDYQIILIPSSKKMQKRRGFNHLKLMLSDCKLEVIDLFEKEDSVQRFKKDRSLSDFKLKYPPNNLDKVIIFDDVITSGTSVLNAINSISKYCQKIVIITVAKNLKKKETYARKSKVV